MNIRTEINEFQQTFTIKADNGAHVSGYLSDGEIFFIFVPIELRRQGIAKVLLRAAGELIERSGEMVSFTSAISDAGAGLIDWWYKHGEGELT